MKTRRQFRGLTLALLTPGALPGAGAYAQKATPAYAFTDLGGLSGLPFEQSEALAINDAGQVAGFSYAAGRNGSYGTHPVLWAKNAARARPASRGHQRERPGAVKDRAGP